MHPSKSVSTSSTRAPYVIACESCSADTFPRGSSTALGIPARAAYAAIDADVSPVEAQITRAAPTCPAHDTPATMPRSLKLSVGFSPSCLSHSVPTPQYARTRSPASYRGVSPSLSVTTRSLGRSGSSTSL